MVVSVASVVSTASADPCNRDSYRELLNGLSGDSGPLYRVRVSPEEGSKMVLEGRVRKLELSPDYRVYFVRDEKGRIHLVDSRSGVEEGRIERIEEHQSATRARAEVEMDFDAAKKHLCAEYARIGSTPEFQQAKGMLEDKLRLQRLRASSAWRCALDSVATFIPAFVMDPSQMLRTKWAKEKKHKTLRGYLDHAGNFYETMILMGAIQHCSVYWGGTAYGPALLRSLKWGVGANVVSEVNVAGAPVLNLPDTAVRALADLDPKDQGLRMVSDRNRSDWGDLTTGTLGAGGYLAWSVLSKKLFRFDFDQACK
jgi:hypothetical protein